MTWFKVDDKLAGNPKARAAGLRPMGLWVMAGSWSSQQLTDGWVPRWFVNEFTTGRRDADRLVEAGLWVPADGGWEFHDWTQANPTRVAELARLEYERRRKAEWRAARVNGRRDA